MNIITRSGGNQPSFDAAYYGQPASLTSQPVRTTDSTGKLESGYERATYRDFTTSLGGPVVRDRVWFFAGYQYLRDADSQPGTDPDHPRRYDQDKVFGKVTWRFSPSWQLDQSFHDEYWTTGERPTVVRPFEATQRLDAHTPVINFGHLTHTLSGNTIWDVRFSRFHFSQETSPSTGDRTIPNRVDQPGDVWSQAPQQIGGAEQIRNTGKATATHYRAGASGVDQEWKFGGQFDKGQHRGLIVLPTGERVVYTNGVLSQRVQQKPSNSGGQFVTAGAFVSDAMTIHDRATISAGLRYDYSRAMSPDIAILDGNGDKTGATAPGAGHLYTWNVWSPRVGATIKLDHSGRSMLRATYGRFSQGMLTGEMSSIHSGVTPITTIEVLKAHSPRLIPKPTWRWIHIPASRTRMSTRLASIARSAASSPCPRRTSGRTAAISSAGSTPAERIAPPPSFCQMGTRFQCRC